MPMPKMPSMPREECLGDSELEDDSEQDAEGDDAEDDPDDDEVAGAAAQAGVLLHGAGGGLGPAPLPHRQLAGGGGVR